MLQCSGSTGGFRGMGKVVSRIVPSLRQRAGEKWRHSMAPSLFYAL